MTKILHRFYLLPVAAIAIAIGVAAPAPTHAQAQPTIGKIKRDENGRIVPDTRPNENAREMSSAPPSSSGRGLYPGQILMPGLEPDRSEFAEKARQRQNEVAKILGEEKQAKTRGGITDAQGLTPREQMLLVELTREDREVRAHELAHYYTGRPYTVDPEYWFVTGPLGGRFAVAGHVRFDLSPAAGDPKTTLQKYEVLRRAARAPSTPSPYDLKVAAELDRAIERIRADMAESSK